MGFLSASLVLVFLVSSNLGGLTQAESVKTFIERLEANSYQKSVAPDGQEGPGSPVKVLVTSYFLDVNKVDDSSMDFNAHFYFRQKWNDSRLMHNLDGGTEQILLDNAVQYIWTPDLFFIEERRGKQHQVTKPNVFCRIYSSGLVHISYKFSVTFSCPMDLRSYPHDIQKCLINIESYGYDRKYVQLEWGDPGKLGPAAISEDITMHEFAVTELKTSRKDEEFHFGNYTSLQIHLIFKRKFGFFATRLYVPFIILVLLTSLSLWIKAEERSLRLALLLVIFYLMVNISTSVNSLTPSAPYTKASDVWIAFCESLVFAAFLEFVAVALIARKESKSGSKGEILLSMDPEDKENKLKSPLTKVLNMFDARQGGSRNSLSLRIDKTCRFLFPITFIIFNIIYWSVYCCL